MTTRSKGVSGLPLETKHLGALELCAGSRGLPGDLVGPGEVESQADVSGVGVLGRTELPCGAGGLARADQDDGASVNETQARPPFSMARSINSRASRGSLTWRKASSQARALSAST